MKKTLLLAILCAAMAVRTVGADEINDVSPELERSVTRGLDYLVETQNDDGSWPGNYGQLSGVVGLCVLTFLAHGEQPGEGPYGRAIDKAVEYLVNTQQEGNGLLQGKSGMSPMYSHGFATLALAEVYGMSDNPKVGPALKKAIELIVSAQNAAGGWRYNVTPSDADTTVSGAQMVALRGAATAAMEVPGETISKGVTFYKSCFCPGGGFGYTNASGANATRAGIGLLVLSLSGAYRDPETKATADYLFYQGPDRGGHYYYMTYYASQAMRQAGGKYWAYWNRNMTPAIMARQSEDGSWTGGQDKVLDTAFALLSIEINYDYLPIYQR